MIDINTKNGAKLYIYVCVCKRKCSQDTWVSIQAQFGEFGEILPVGDWGGGGNINSLVKVDLWERSKDEWRNKSTYEFAKFQALPGNFFFIKSWFKSLFSFDKKIHLSRIFLGRLRGRLFLYQKVDLCMIPLLFLKILHSPVLISIQSYKKWFWMKNEWKKKKKFS